MAALGLLCFACSRRRRPSGPRGVRAASRGEGDGADSRPAAESSAALAAAAADKVEEEEVEAQEASESHPLGVLAMEKGVEVVSDDHVGIGRKRPTPTNRRPAPLSNSPSASSANRLTSSESTARSVDKETKGREEEEGRGGTERGSQEQLDFSALTRVELLSAATNKDKANCARRRTATQRRPPSRQALRRILCSDRDPDGSGDEGDTQLAATGIIRAAASSVKSTGAAKRRALLGAKSAALRVGPGPLILPPVPVNLAPAPTLSAGNGSTNISRGSASDRKKLVESYVAPRCATRVSSVNEGAGAAVGGRRKYASQPLVDLGRSRATPVDGGGVAAFDDGADTVSAARRHLTVVLASVVPPLASASQLSLPEMTAADRSSAAPASSSELDVAGAKEPTRVISQPQSQLPLQGDSPPETSPTVSGGLSSDRQPEQASARDATFDAAASTFAASDVIARAEAEQAFSGNATVPAAVLRTTGARTVVSLKQWTPLLPNAPARRTHGLRLYGDSVDGGRRIMYASQPSLTATGSAGSGKSVPSATRLRSGVSLNWIAEPFPPAASAASGSQQQLSGDGGNTSRPLRATATPAAAADTAARFNCAPPPLTVDGPGRYGSRSHLPEAQTYEPAAGRALLLGGLAADMHPLEGQQDAAGASPAGAAGGYSAAPAPQRQLAEDSSSRLVGQQCSTQNEAASDVSVVAALGAMSNGYESSLKQLRQPAPSVSTPPPSPENEADQPSFGKTEGPRGGQVRQEVTTGDGALRRLTSTSTPPASPLSDGGGLANSSAFGDGGCGGDAWSSATPVSFSRSRLASAEIRMPQSVAAGASAAAVRERALPPPPPPHTPTPPATVGWRLARDDAPPATPSRRPPWCRPTRVTAAVDDDEHATTAAHFAPPRSRSVDQGLGKASTAAAPSALWPRRSAADGAAAATATAAAVAAPPPPTVVRRSNSIAATVSPTAAATASIPNWVLMAADKSRRLSRIFKEDAYGSTSALEGMTATAAPSAVTSPPPSRPQVILHRGRVASAPASTESALSQPPTPQADSAGSAAKEEVWEQPATNGHRVEVEPKCARQLDDNDRRRSVALADAAVIVDAESAEAVAAEKSAAVVPSSLSGRPQCGDSPTAVPSSAAANGHDGGGVHLPFGERVSLTNGVHLHNGAVMRHTNGIDTTKLPADTRHNCASEYQSPEVDVTKKFPTLRRSQSAAARFTRPSTTSAESGAVEEPEFVKLARARLARRREAGIITEEDDC